MDKNKLISFETLQATGIELVDDTVMVYQNVPLSMCQEIRIPVWFVEQFIAALREVVAEPTKEQAG